MDKVKLIAALTEQAASNRELADAIRLQTLGLHALADAIAAPVETDEDEQARLGGDDVPRFMDGTPIDG